MAKSRFEEILAQVTERYAEGAEFALVEGLPPLARIALTARFARRATRFFALQLEFARKTVEDAIRVAEKAAGGELLRAQEEESARDITVLRACECEAREGSKAAAEAAQVARLTVRCINGPEIAYGETVYLAAFRLQSAVRNAARSRGLEAGEVEQAVLNEVDGMRSDVKKLVLCADTCGEGWMDPGTGATFPG